MPRAPPSAESHPNMERDGCLWVTLKAPQDLEIAEHIYATMTTLVNGHRRDDYLRDDALRPMGNYPEQTEFDEEWLEGVQNGDLALLFIQQVVCGDVIIAVSKDSHTYRYYSKMAQRLEDGGVTIGRARQKMGEDDGNLSGGNCYVNDLSHLIIVRLEHTAALHASNAPTCNFPGYDFQRNAPLWNLHKSVLYLKRVQMGSRKKIVIFLGPGATEEDAKGVLKAACGMADDDERVSVVYLIKGMNYEEQAVRVGAQPKGHEVLGYCVIGKDYYLETDMYGNPREIRRGDHWHGV